MKVSFLAKNEKVKERLERIDLPDSSNIQIGRFASTGTYIVTVTLKDNNIKAARELSDYRDSAIDISSLKLIVDEPSTFFCFRLYRRFADFECGLRAVILIVLYAYREAFTDEILKNSIKMLNQWTLEELEQWLFVDKDFTKAAKQLTKHDALKKEELIAKLQQKKERTYWERLFGDDMPLTKHHFSDMRKRRNDVMHFHIMSYDDYRSSLRLSNLINNEIQRYLLDSISNIHYLDNREESAKSALIDLSSIYKTLQVVSNNSELSQALQNVGPAIQSLSSINQNLFSSSNVWNSIRETSANLSGINAITDSIVFASQENNPPHAISDAMSRLKQSSSPISDGRDSIDISMEQDADPSHSLDNQIDKKTDNKSPSTRDKKDDTN